jgi:hypothetical protein
MNNNASSDKNPDANKNNSWGNTNNINNSNNNSWGSLNPNNNIDDREDNNSLAITQATKLIADRMGPIVRSDQPFNRDYLEIYRNFIIAADHEDISGEIDLNTDPLQEEDDQGVSDYQDNEKREQISKRPSIHSPIN